MSELYEIAGRGAIVVLGSGQQCDRDIRTIMDHCRRFNSLRVDNLACTFPGMNWEVSGPVVGAASPNTIFISTLSASQPEDKGRTLRLERIARSLENNTNTGAHEAALVALADEGDPTATFALAATRAALDSMRDCPPSDQNNLFVYTLGGIRCALSSTRYSTFATRRILRNQDKVIDAWRCELSMRLMTATCYNTGVYSDPRIAFAAGDLVKEYYDLRRDNLVDPYRDEICLSRSASIQDAYNNVYRRVSGVAAALDPTSERGGPALSYGDFQINVHLAYGILRFMGRALNSVTSESGANALNLSGADTFPVIIGQGHIERVMAGLELIKTCCNLIKLAPPCLKPNMEGALPANQWTANIPEPHVDISENARVRAAIPTCTRCGCVAPNPVVQGGTFRGRPVELDGIQTDARYCASCAESMLTLAYDTASYHRSNKVMSISAMREARSTGHRNGVNIPITAGTVSQFNRTVLSACGGCGNPTFNREKVLAFTDPNPGVQRRIRLLGDGVSMTANQEEFDMIPQGLNDCSRQGLPSDTVIILSTSVLVHDMESDPSMRCRRCANPARLYQDPATGKYYTSIDASPSAPEYGYKVPDPSGRFLDRVIGIEFETGPGSAQVGVERMDAFLNEACSDGTHIWHIHGDGSLMGGACEITTPPIGGLAIPMGVDAMFNLAKKYGFNIENRSAGMHIHTNITDLFEVMMPIRTRHRAGETAATNSYREFCNLLGRFGDAMSQLSRQFVSKARRSNTYCQGGFGVRSWNCGDQDPMMRYQSSSLSGRSAVCIHRHDGYARRTKVTYTLENRIWPSSNSKTYTLARAELTQKAIDKFVGLSIEFLSNPDAAHRAVLDQFVTLVETTPRLRIDRRVQATVDLFGLSDETKAALDAIHRRYFYISYYAHEHNLSMGSPEITNLVKESLRSVGINDRTVDDPMAYTELAGILAAKGLSSPTVPDTLRVLHHTMNMDTTIASLACDPMATDASDLSSAAPLSIVNN
jgi:hypothetical protein